MPGWLRGDAWAVVRMVDRVASTYLRGGVMLARWSAAAWGAH